MKKLSLYLLLSLIAGWSLTSCDESHSDFVEPEVYPQEEVFPGDAFDGITVTPTATAGQNINIDYLVENNIDSVQLFTVQMGTLPEGCEFSSLRMEAWLNKDANPTRKEVTEFYSTNVPASIDGKIAKEDLATLVYTFFGKKATERVFTAKLYGNIIKGKEAQLISLGDFVLKITPQELENPYYYVYGNAISNDPKSAYKTVMTPDPESDVVYSYTTYYMRSGDINIWNSKYWLAEKDKTFGIDYSKLYGSGEEKGANFFGEEGALAQGDENKKPSISSPSRGYYTFTIDLEERTYKWVKLDNQNPTAYDKISLEAGGTSSDMEGADYVSGLKKTVKTTSNHNWFVELTLTADTQVKFCANNDPTLIWGYGSTDGEWTVNEDIWAKTCVANGSGITVPAGHYYVYFCDITGAAHFVPVD